MIPVHEGPAPKSYIRQQSMQQSVDLSVQSIDSYHRRFLSRQQPRFLQATLHLDWGLYFQQQALSGIESTFNFASGRFEELWSLQLKENAVEWMKANPTRSATVWIDHCRFGNVFKLHFIIHLILHLNEYLPNVARYGRKMSNVHQCHPRAVKRLWMVLWIFVISDSVINVAIYKILINRAWSEYSIINYYPIARF